jgi:hypothetical protein
VSFCATGASETGLVRVDPISVCPALFIIVSDRVIVHVASVVVAAAGDIYIARVTGHRITIPIVVNRCSETVDDVVCSCKCCLFLS